MCSTAQHTQDDQSAIKEHDQIALMVTDLGLFWSIQGIERHRLALRTRSSRLEHSLHYPRGRGLVLAPPGQLEADRPRQPKHPKHPDGLPKVTLHAAVDAVQARNQMLHGLQEAANALRLA